MRLINLLVAAGLALPFALLSIEPVEAQGAKKGGKKSAEPAEKAPKDAEEEDGGDGPKEKKEASDLEIQGNIGSLAKGSTDTFDFKYLEIEGKKKVRKKAWLKIDSSATLLADRASADMSGFKEGETVMIFAKVFDQPSPGLRGESGRDRRLNAARVVIGGKKVEVNEEFKDPKDDKFKWCETTIEKPGPSPTVTYSSGSFRVSTDKGAAIILRGDGDPKKNLRRNALIWVQAAKAGEKPSGEKEDRPVFTATKVLILAPSCLRWYPAVLPQK